jgi:hypothetical protein
MIWITFAQLLCFVVPDRALVYRVPDPWAVYTNIVWPAGRRLLHLLTNVFRLTCHPGVFDRDWPLHDEPGDDVFRPEYATQ